MEKGFMYITAIIDVYSRYIVGWHIGNSLEADVSVNLLKECIKKYGKPEIVNSDQGCQYTSKEWIKILKNSEIQINMDGKGRATDNIWIERFWRTLKRGHIYIRPAEDGLELRKGVKDYINYYNHKRAHTELGGVAPSLVYLNGDDKPMVKRERKNMLQLHKIT